MQSFYPPHQVSMLRLLDIRGIDIPMWKKVEYQQTLLMM